MFCGKNPYVGVHKMSVKRIEDALRRALDGDYSVSVKPEEVDPEYREMATIAQKTIQRLKASNQFEQMLDGVDAFIENFPRPIAVQSPERSCLMLNEKYCELMRGTKEDLRHKRLSDFNITVTAGDSIYASFDTKRNAQTDLIFTWDDGSKNYVKLNQIPVLDAKGEISAVYYVFLDETEIYEEREEVSRLQRRADAFLQENPQGITVLAGDKHRLDLNKEYQRIWRGEYDELMAKKLYDFDIKVVGGDDFYASYETKKKSITDMEISWGGDEKSYLRLFQTPILDENGEIDVNYYIYQDLTPERALSQFLGREITRQAANLDRLAHGDTRSFDLTVGDTDEYTADAGVLFEEMNANLAASQQAIAAMVEDFIGTMKAQKAGNSKARASPDQFEGVYAVLIRGLNDILDTIYNPVNESYRVLKMYAEKDFSVRFNDAIHVEGDHDKLRQAINRVGVNIGEAIKEVKLAAEGVDLNITDASRGIEEITKAMEDVAVSSQQSSEASHRQLEAVEAVAREISDLSASIEEIASTTQEVRSLSENVSSMGNEASKLGQQANEKMGAVEKIAEESVIKIDELNKKMVEISKIVKLITDISNQTNLLALNAAIEAARAGEHGRGFAVVAGEVRNLAAESKSATNSIEELIEGIQKDSADTANSMKSAYGEIQAGLSSVDLAIQSLQEIVTGAKEAAQGVSEIAAATDDQANATNRVMEKMEETTELTKENLRRVDDVAAVTEEVAASAEEVGSGAQEVSQMSERLRDLVNVFRVE